MESGVRLLLLLSTLLFPLAVSDLIQVDATSDAPLLELPPFGLGPNGRIRADIIIGNDTSPSPGRWVLVLSLEQFELWAQSIKKEELMPGARGVVNTNRPSMYRKEFCCPGDRIQFDISVRGDRPDKYIMFIANPQQPGNSSSSRMVRPIIGVPLRERQPSAEQIGFIESPLLVDTPPMSPEAYLRGDEDEDTLDNSGQFEQPRLQLLGSVRFEQADGRQLDYQLLPLASCVLGLATAVVASAVLYYGFMASAWRRYYTLLHVFHLSVLLWMSLYFSLWYRSLKEQDVTGNPNTVTARWLPQLSQKIYDILELMMYLLTALGWQTSRPRLNRTEVRFAGVISTVSMYLGFFEITCTSEQVCAGYRLSRLILHSLAYLCIIVAVNFHLAVINNQIREAGISLDTGRMYQRFYAYSAFRVAFLLFIIQPTVMLFIQMSVFSWYEEWAVTLIYWLIKWLLLLAVAWSFKPRPSSNYFRARAFYISVVVQEVLCVLMILWRVTFSSENLKLFNIAVADQRREFEEDDEQQQRDRGGEGAISSTRL